MDLLELGRDIGLNLTKTSNSNGGEYHGSCPGCGEGKDRFVIWPEQDRYWCRRCEAKGDAIQFCRDFMSMTYKEACDKLMINTNNNQRNLAPQSMRASVIADPPLLWQAKALIFAEWA